MVKFLVGLAALASIAFADITFNCIGYPAQGNFIGVSINGVITRLAALENTAPVWTGVVAGATSAVQYSYVEINAANTPVKTEAFVRKLNQTTDIATENEFFDRPITHHVVPRLPYTYLATYPSKSKAFKETQIATLHLTGDKAVIDKLNASPETDGAEARVTFRFINAKTIYTQQNITLKTSGKSSKEFAKQSYKIKFDTDFNQTFFSRPNLKLRSMATEPTYLREKVYIDTLNAVGVPTQQGSYVRLYINNEPYGLYLMVDDIKKSFLKQTVHGGDNVVIPGSLIQANAPTVSEQADLAYKGPLTAAYGKETYITQNLGNNVVTEPLGQLITFMKDLQDFDPVATPDPVAYWNARLDLDGFLRNMALEYLFGGFDNYWMAGSNYFIYFNPTLGTGKWQWLPTDFDGTFGNGAEIDPLGSYKTLFNFQPDHPLVSKLIIKNTAINGLFNTVLKEIVSTTFKPEAMNPHIEAINKMISLDAAWDFALVRKSPGKNPGFTFDDFNNNLVNITKDMSGAIKPWIAARANTTSVELQFTIPAGTTDRVPPPPRKGGNGDDDDEETPEGGNAANGVSARAVGSVMAVVAMVASSLMLLA